MIETTTIYEEAYTNGYRSIGTSRFFKDENRANQAAKIKHGHHGTSCLKHIAISDNEGRFYLLKQANPISIAGTRQAREDIAKVALDKLSEAEKDALGLS